MWPFNALPAHYGTVQEKPVELPMCFTMFCNRCRQLTTQEFIYSSPLGQSAFKCRNYHCTYYNYADTPEAIKCLQHIL